MTASALSTQPSALPRRKAGELRPGDRVRLDWTENHHHGAEGVVHTIADRWIGVVWRLDSGEFFARMSRERLKRIGGRR